MLYYDHRVSHKIDHSLNYFLSAFLFNFLAVATRLAPAHIAPSGSNSIRINVSKSKFLSVLSIPCGNSNFDYYKSTVSVGVVHSTK